MKVQTLSLIGFSVLIFAGQRKLLAGQVVRPQYTPPPQRTQYTPPAERPQFTPPVERPRYTPPLEQRSKNYPQPENQPEPRQPENRPRQPENRPGLRNRSDNGSNQQYNNRRYQGPNRHLARKWVGIIVPLPENWESDNNFYISVGGDGNFYLFNYAFPDFAIQVTALDTMGDDQSVDQNDPNDQSN